MKGNNELRLNQATVVEALQEYLDKRYTPAVIVKAVENASSGYAIETFTVKIEEKPNAEAK